jgi:hypothetical protein
MGIMILLVWRRRSLTCSRCDAGFERNCDDTQREMAVLVAPGVKDTHCKADVGQLNRLSGDFGSPGKGAHGQSRIVAFQPRSPTIIADSRSGEGGNMFPGCGIGIHLVGNQLTEGGQLRETRQIGLFHDMVFIARSDRLHDLDCKEFPSYEIPRDLLGRDGFTGSS